MTSRTTRWFSLALALAGCADVGPFRAHDDEGLAPDAAIDAAASPDAPAACAVTTPIAMLTVGTVQAPLAGDHFSRPTTGPHAGETVLVLAAGLPGATANTADVLVLEVAKRSGFRTGSAYAFDPTPSATYIAAAYILADYDFTTQRPAARYWASTGALTLAAIGEAPGSTIRGSVGTTTFREIDAQNRDVPGGCRPTLAGVSFVLTQQAATAQVPQPASLRGRVLDASRR